VSLTDPRALAPLLWILLGLFILRVAGQMLVAFAGVHFLPPMQEWYSGLLAYEYLLPAQIVIIVAMTIICLHFSQGAGFFVVPRPAFGTPALYFGCLYFIAMIVRYILRMAFVPEARWFGGTIPIIFHCVLATFVILFALHHRARLRQSGQR
jgi:uncharacterized protein